jgi:hypothetical protein
MRIEIETLGFWGTDLQTNPGKPLKHCGFRYLPSNTFANLIKLELNP